MAEIYQRLCEVIILVAEIYQRLCEVIILVTERYIRDCVRIITIPVAKRYCISELFITVPHRALLPVSVWIIIKNIMSSVQWFT